MRHISQNASSKDIGTSPLTVETEEDLELTITSTPFYVRNPNQVKVYRERKVSARKSKEISPQTTDRKSTEPNASSIYTSFNDAKPTITQPKLKPSFEITKADIDGTISKDGTKFSTLQKKVDVATSA